MKRHAFSFRSQLFLGTLLVSLLPLFLCSTLMLAVFSATAKQKSRDEGTAMEQTLAGQLNSALQEQNDALLALSQEQDAAALLAEGDDAAQEAYIDLYRAANSTGGAADFSLYDADGVLRYTTREDNEAVKLPVYWGLLRRAGMAQQPVFAAQLVSDLTSRDSMCVKGALALRASTGGTAGYLVCSMSLGQTETLLNGQLSGGAELYIVTEQWRLVYSSRLRDDTDRIDEMRMQLFDGVAYTGDMEGFIGQEPLSGLVLILDYPAAVSTDALALMRTVSLMFGAVSLLLCVLVSRWLANSQFKPIGELSDAMAAVRRGDLTVRIPAGRRDEFGRLADTFNQMTERLEEHVREQVQHQRDLNDAQIRQMQAQLNPHFLYNTLDTMKWLAKIHQLPEVASLAGNLAAILRASINSEQFVPLWRELELVEQYVGIQTIRFSGRFRCIISVPEALQSCIVPKLVLQPMVENAILHGLDGCADGCIYIYGWETDGDISLSVTDDGCGLPPDILARINEPQPKLLEGHLGLYNVPTILKLHYGAQYGLRASSIAGVGTTVTLVMPVQREGEEKC